MNHNQPTWIDEITAVAKACGHQVVYFPDRGGVPCVGLTYDDVHFPSHMNEVVWEYLKENGDAENWLTLWLNACTHSRSERSTTPN